MKLRRVVGPPGCGKTTFLAGEASRYVKSIGEGNILIASLTRAAAAEVAGRDSGVEAGNVGTLHSHAYRALGAAGLAVNPVIADSPKGVKEWNETCPPQFRLTEDAKIRDTDDLYGDYLGGDQVADIILSEYVILRQRMVPVDNWPQNVKQFHQYWTEFKLKNEMIDFTDMIDLCVKNEIPPKRNTHVLFVDEAQDLSRLEFGLVQQWGDRGEETIIVGDPDQNLYEWRGSDPMAFYEHEAEMSVLEQSYRVPKAVHERAVRWIELTPDRKKIAYLPTKFDGLVANDSMAIWTFPDALIRMAQEHTYNGESMMILASCKYMLGRTVSLLRQEGIPFHNPYRRKDGQWNPLHITKMPQRVLSLLRPNQEVWGDEARMWTMFEVRQWGELLSADCFAKRGVKSWLETITPYDNRIVSFDVLLKLFKEHVVNMAYEGNVKTWQKMLTADNRKIAEFTVRVWEVQGGRALREEPKVVIGTIHSVKGGEADHVYLWPDVSSAAARHFYDRRSPDPATIRTFYVGMTRARQALHLLPPVPNGYFVEL